MRNAKGVKSVTVGVISDTHGLLRDEVFDHFQGVDCIVHAGDVGSEDILIQLGALAPVHAVCGNTDGFPLIERLPESRTLTVGGVGIFVTHIGGTPREMKSRFPQIQNCRVAIFGHTHKPLQLQHEGILFFNPGSAGPRRFSLPVTLGKIDLASGSVTAQIIHLDKRNFPAESQIE